MRDNVQSETVISFVIPACNEADFIGDTLGSIRKYFSSFPSQIIVVDNNSTDCTSKVAQPHCDLLVNHPGGTIASARNKGASVSVGKVLIFLDADVLLTSNWQKQIDSTVETLLRNPSIVTGSRCSVQDEKDWFSRYWFLRMQDITINNYINSGHLITSRKLFDSIGGFAEKLHTAEDYDFCMRAKEVGGKF